jgi:hypothetical protein
MVQCRADVGAGALTCEPPVMEGSFAPQLSIIVGGQGVYVQLTSSNVSYSAATEIFQADVTVQNLMSQSLGTLDGSTATGVKVFFHTGPDVTSGTGTVTVRNADGTGAFTGSSQPYHEYVEILSTGDISAPKTWEWDVSSTVQTFVFEVYVEADVPPEAWPGLWQGRHLGSGWDVGVMGMVFTVNPEGTGITEITYYLDEFGCGTATYWGFAKRTQDYPGWGITGDQLDYFCNALASDPDPDDLAVCHRGTFNGDFVSGSWDGSWGGIPITFCSGSWNGKPATRLFPRYDGSQLFLSTETSPPGENWIAQLNPGVTVEWSAVLDDALKGDVFTFQLLLRGDGGDFYVTLKVNQSSFAWATFDASTEFDYHGVTDWTFDGWNEPRGEQGDELILMITYQGSGIGEFAFGHDVESFIVVPGRVAVSLPSAPALATTAADHDVSRYYRSIDILPGSLRIK